MNAKITRLFKIAQKESANSEYCYKIGSVFITRSGEVFKGHNKIKTHTRSNHSYRNIHAELDVLLKVGIHNKNKIDGGTMVLYRETTLGIACAKPCRFCEKILNEFNINNVYYTDIDGYWYIDKTREAQKIS
jgi:cytidine deaminase